MKGIGTDETKRRMATHVVMVSPSPICPPISKLSFSTMKHLYMAGLSLVVCILVLFSTVSLDSCFADSGTNNHIHRKEIKAPNHGIPKGIMQGKSLPVDEISKISKPVVYHYQNATKISSTTTEFSSMVVHSKGGGTGSATADNNNEDTNTTATPAASALALAVTVPIQQIYLLGERNSGTNYIEQTLFLAFPTYQSSYSLLQKSNVVV